MSISTKIRLAILASAITLVAAAPSAFAQNAGTWMGNIHTDPSYGAAEGGASHSREVMEKKIVPSNVAPNTGTWYQDIHTDPSTGAADGGGATHSKEIMNKKSVSSSSFPPGYWEKQQERDLMRVGG